MAMRRSQTNLNEEFTSTSTLQPIKSHSSQQALARPSRTPLRNVQFAASSTSLITEAGKPGRKRWVLQLQARMWRFLMKIGMFLHARAAPRPMKPTFSRVIPTTVSPRHGEVRIQFYTPLDYYVNIQLGRKYPVVVNFHGGGFTLGEATDDCRWASMVCFEVNAVVASVDYRLAPEFPFPTAVEDGVDAVMYIAAHASKLGIDRDQIAVSGFSSGANMAFTVPLRMQQEINPDPEKGNMAHMEDLKFISRPQTPTSEQTPNAEEHVHVHQPRLESKRDPELYLTPSSKSRSIRPYIGHRQDTQTVVRTPIKPFDLAAIVAWYPPTDYTRSREQRRATNARPDQELSSMFTSLFDESYLPPVADRSSPYLSPGVAPDAMLTSLPPTIVLTTCEYDSLLNEAEAMRDRLADLGKQVHYSIVPGAPHAWDKATNPFRTTPHVKEFYMAACAQLRAAFGEEPSSSGDGVLKGVARRMSTLVKGSLPPRLSLSHRLSLGKRGSRDVGMELEEAREEYEDEAESRAARHEF